MECKTDADPPHTEQQELLLQRNTLLQRISFEPETLLTTDNLCVRFSRAV